MQGKARLFRVRSGMAGEVRSVGAWNVKFRYGRHGMSRQYKAS